MTSTGARIDRRQSALASGSCGPRVVRITLRPCSVSRILLRELLRCVDIVDLLSPIPAVFAILSNEQRQRIGDLVADSIVVEQHLPKRGSTVSESH